MAKRPLLLPEPFSGEASLNWDEWLVHFENCAAVNSWESDEEKLRWIRVHRTGKAQTALQWLSGNAHTKYSIEAPFSS